MTVLLPLKILASQLEKFGMNEMLRTLIECADTDTTGSYLRYLVYLEWIKNHPKIKEEGEEENGTN